VTQVVQVGVSHASAPLHWRERLAIGGHAVGPVAARLARSAAAREALVLATCSRVEAYVVGPDAGRLELELLARLARRAGRPLEELASVVDVRHGADAARHLLRTAAGLESPVLGEPEILGQLRHAHRSASAAAATGPALEQLVAHAVRAGRRVRAETGLATGAASFSSTVAVLARRLFGDRGGRRALVTGRTRTAHAAADRLRGDGWSVTTEPRPALSAFDVVVACSGTGAAIGRETLRAAAHARTGTPLLVVDLSVPRDVDPAARGLAGVLLYDVDEVARAGRHALAARRAHVPAAEAVVEEELRRFEGWRATRALVPTIKALREQQRRAVVDVLGELPDDVVERLVTRLLHGPTARLREAAVAGAGEHWVRTARELFDLGDHAAVRPPATARTSPRAA
jgi:glutamyl-tRNA reductase